MKMKSKQTGSSEFGVFVLVLIIFVIASGVSENRKQFEMAGVKSDVEFETRSENPFERKPIVVIERKERFVKFKDENGVETISKVEDFIVKYKRK